MRARLAERLGAATTLGIVASVAVAVAGVAVGVTVVAARSGEGADPGGPTVPSVFAHTRASAQALLEAAGYQVRFGKQDGCTPAGRPVATEPATGTPVRRGDTVTVLLSYQGPLTDCAGFYDGAWQFLDYANGRGPAPAIAPTVRVFVDGRRAGTMTAALAALREASIQVRPSGDGLATPDLQVYDGTPPAVVCGVDRPAAVGDREAETLVVAFPQESRTGCPARVSLYRTDGAIDVVALTSPQPAGRRTSDDVPDVVGENVTDARALVTGAGYTARVEEQETCSPRDVVVEQAPTQREVDADAADDPDWSRVVTLVVQVPSKTRDCVALDAAAAALVDFARGGPPPDWAPRVQQVVGNALQDTIPAAAADDPAAWSEVLAAVRRGPSTAAEFRDTSECEMVDLGGLPSGLWDGKDQITLFPTAPADCGEDWTVGIWIDDAGAIRAVNLLLPRSAGED